MTLEILTPSEIKIYAAGLEIATGPQGPTGPKGDTGDTGLPKPTIIKSGRGAHIYWILKDRIS